MNAPHNQITDFIVHKLIKEPHQRVATTDPRKEPLAINPTIERLVNQIHKLYAERMGKGYGRFEANEDEYPSQKYIRRHLIDRQTTFLELSLELMEHLRARAEREALARGGYVLIALINNGATDFLLVAIVTEVLGAAITEGKDVVDSVHLDMSQLRVAGRVDLTAWQTGAERYISFLKNRGDVAEYFQLFLGCNDLLIALEESKKLVIGLERLADEMNLDSEKRDRLLNTGHQYLEELSKTKTPVSLDALTNHLWPDDPEAFRKILAAEDLSLSDGFVPDRRAIRALVKFEGKSRFWKLNFDRQALRCGDLRYDKKTDTIVLSSIPDELRKELLDEEDDD
ncbi:MAG: nucleoid-associated protein [Zoogloea sp.]|nr:nucleoid-associated protein [Zoogloea sp.]